MFLAVKWRFAWVMNFIYMRVRINLHRPTRVTVWVRRGYGWGLGLCLGSVSFTILRITKNGYICRTILHIGLISSIIVGEGIVRCKWSRINLSSLRGPYVPIPMHKDPQHKNNNNGFRTQRHQRDNTTVNPTQQLMCCVYMLWTQRNDNTTISQHSGSGNFTLPLCCDVVLSLF